MILISIRAFDGNIFFETVCWGCSLLTLSFEIEYMSTVFSDAGRQASVECVVVIWIEH